MNDSEPTFDFSDLPDIGQGSRLGLEWWIAWGHLRSKSSEAFVNLVTVLAVVGVVVGVALLNCVLGVMTGLEVDLRDKILGTTSHAWVMEHGNAGVREQANIQAVLDDIDGIEASAPFTLTKLMISANQTNDGVALHGVDALRTGDVTQLRESLIQGPDGPVSTPEEQDALFRLIDTLVEPLELEGKEGRPSPALILGKDLAESLMVGPGSKVQLISPLGRGPSVPGMGRVPDVRTVRVLGIFETGMFEYDTSHIYMSNAQVQSFTGMPTTGFEIKAKNPENIEDVCAQVDERIGYPVFCRHWKQMNKSLLAAMQLEKLVMGAILYMVVMVAGLMIVTTLFMMVLTKGREIAILKAIGATRGTILRIFILEGGFIGLIGTVVGTLTGLAGSEFLRWYEWPLEADVYFVKTLPVIIEPVNVVTIAVLAFVTCFLCTLYPAWRAGVLDPVEALRYE